MNQQQLADKIGTSRQRVSRVERDLAEYSFSQLKALQDIAGLPLAFLLNLEDDPPPWINAYMALDKAKRRQLDGFILAAIKLLK